eukprot:GFUD01030013.1.p1 GENE.GFUD01030013.1~~GFUD01030013.1.p1  ORF type:complete len:305 (+),score=114.64 GFUD01030013.1:39-953(+)
MARGKKSKNDHDTENDLCDNDAKEQQDVKKVKKGKKEEINVLKEIQQALGNLNLVEECDQEEPVPARMVDKKAGSASDKNNKKGKKGSKEEEFTNEQPKVEKGRKKKKKKKGKQLDVNANDAPNTLVKTNGFAGITKILGMDCEMVGVGLSGKHSILARVSIVNQFGHTVYDTFVAPSKQVTDYRTAVSGVRPEDLPGAPHFKKVRAEVCKLIAGRILVGHGLSHDFKVLCINHHPKEMIRDTAEYKPFQAAFGGRRPSLKKLAESFLGEVVQTGEHSSVQDSQVAVRLYTMFMEEWEAGLLVN